MSCPPHSPWLDLPNNIWWGVQNMKLLTVQLSPFSCYFIPHECLYSENWCYFFNHTITLCLSVTLLVILILWSHCVKDPGVILDSKLYFHQYVNCVSSHALTLLEHTHFELVFVDSFIVCVTETYHWNLSHGPLQYILYLKKPISLRPFLILSFHLCLGFSDVFPCCSPTKI
jgi:hypothetical protein